MDVDGGVWGRGRVPAGADHGVGRAGVVYAGEDGFDEEA